MKLTSIKVKQLFDLFDYNIEFNQEDNLTILTGPNGYGKTTILNILHNLLSQHFFYFQELKFELLSFSFSDGKRIDITKEENPKQKLPFFINQQQITQQTTDIHVNLYVKDALIDSFIYNLDVENRLMQELRNVFPIHQLSQSLWINDNTKEETTLQDLLNENSDQVPEHIINLIREQSGEHEQISSLLNSINVYLIKEQRLLKQRTLVGSDENTVPFVNTIEAYAKELKDVIAEKQLEAYQIAQELDSSFPKRLIECKEFLSETEFKSRFEALTKKHEQLQQFGISTGKPDVTDYNQETANVLTVYLGDSEKKASVFDDILSKIDLFVTTLNEKRFAFKSIVINGSQGFYFQTDKGQILDLAHLSSGEQHEVVLLYELLFKTAPNTLILIDEPEISLHVIWQKAFIQDLQKIAKMKQISFLISTHSPQIINDRWDLTRDLYELANI